MRKTILTVLLGLGLCAGFAAMSRSQALAPSVDLLLKGGQVVDGTGTKARRADVGIRGDRIVFVGDADKEKVQAARVLDAAGLIVAPGFIDPHTHAGGDLGDAQRKNNVNYLMQGVTTVVVGNDGGGSPEVEATLRKWEQQGIGTNAVLLVGHGAVRRAVLGNGDAQPTPEQLEQMKVLVRRAMDEGASGLSTGLFYVPGNYAKTEEVIELAKVAAELGGIYDSHMRDESSYSIGLLGSIEETIHIGRAAKIPVHISHIKALGPDVWGQSKQAIALIRKARKEGIAVTADQYPYTASGSNLISSVMPAWAQAGRREEVLARLADPSVRPRLMKEMEQNLRRRGGAKALMFRSRQSAELHGKTLEQVAEGRNKPPLETALELITESYRGSGSGSGGLAVVSFNMNEKDVERFMKEEFVMTGSDGSAGHPRMYGTYPRKLREYVYKKKVVKLPFAIRASSGLPAETLRIPERGLLRPGCYADVIAFDPTTVADRATFTEPEQLAVGMKYVLVNGQLAVENGAYTGALAGRPLRRKK